MSVETTESPLAGEPALTSEATAVRARTDAKGAHTDADAGQSSGSTAVTALVESDLLIEDVSIDGMCGVY